MITLDDIAFRTDLRSGDLGEIIRMHGEIYGQEYGYNLHFEAVVAQSLKEFHDLYDPQLSCVWIAEHDGKTVGTIALLNRGNNVAQLRYFLIHPDYRGIGLGSELIRRFMEFFAAKDYRSSYLLTTDDLPLAASLYEKQGYKLVGEYQSDEYGRQHKRRRYELHL